MITMRSQYSAQLSPCCGTTLHRPAESAYEGSPWFCFDCGTAYLPDPLVSGQLSRAQVR